MKKMEEIKIFKNALKKGGYDPLTNYPQSAIEKLEMIIDYNYYTNCVNKCDLSLSSYLFSIQTVNGE